MGNTELKYRTFDELINEVATDFVMYNNEGMIEPGQLIKVVQRVNYDLGLRIHGTKEVILDIEKCKTKLPSDFYVLNYAFLCGSVTTLQPTLQGRHTENVILNSDNCVVPTCYKYTIVYGGGPSSPVGEITYTDCNGVTQTTGVSYDNPSVTVCARLDSVSSTWSGDNIIKGAACSVPNATGSCSHCGNADPVCMCERTYSVECKTGEKIYVQVVEKRGLEVKTYETFDRVHISTATGKKDALDNGVRSGYIKNGFIYTNIDNGRLYISYQGALEDMEGNLLVLDHPMINEYYEYAIKARILENLYMNGEDVVQKMQLVEQRLRAARNNALTIVNTPDFAEMKQVWEMNRKAQYAKYYDQFKSGYGW